MISIQRDFGGGMNQIQSEANIADNEYLLLINGRARFGAIEKVPKHVEDITAPVGIKQGLFTIGNVKLLFVAGKAYARIEDTVGWTQIPGFLMSTTANEYWVQDVPASTLDYLRKLNVNTNIKAPMNVVTDVNIQGNIAALVIQDGENQPWLIIYNPISQTFTARVSGTFASWQNVTDTLYDREYVPIGRQMMYMNGVLYIVSRDKKSVMRSITGRPLDFMINVDIDGNKASTEALGGASTLSFSFDGDDITCIKETDVANSFIYATARNTRIITADYTETLFDEPTFKRTAIIEAGIVNQDSMAQVLNDFVGIDEQGCISFNAVAQFRVEGKFSIFSKNLAKLLNGVKQRYCRMVNFDNYAIFNLDTVMGNVILIYDTLRQVWVSVDITEAIRIKRFAITVTTTTFRLYAITQDDKLFQMYASTTEVYPRQLYTKSFVDVSSNYAGATRMEETIEHKGKSFTPAFEHSTFAGTATLIELVDGELGQYNVIVNGVDNGGRLTIDLPSNLAGVNYPVIPPVMPSNLSQGDAPSFILVNGKMGRQLSYVLLWDNDATLTEFEVVTTSSMGNLSQKQKAATYAT